MTILSRDDILKVSDITLEKVSVPEWGGDIYVKGLTGAERDAFEQSLVVSKGKSRAVNMNNFRAKLAALTICDADGVRMFEDSDMRLLTQKSAAALQRVFVVARRLSNIQNEDVEELTETLEADPFEDSPSA